VPFADVLGQEAAKRLLGAALRGGRLAHAYLFHGPSGVGKTTLARSLFRAALCPRSPGEGCGACPTCARVDRRAHADVHELLVPEGKRSIPVEDVRALIAETGRKPVEGALRFFLVDDAHRLGEESANALLKTLEEPPAGTVLVLTALRREAVLRTVASRCQGVRFFRLPEAEVEKALLDRRVAPDAAAARSAARLAEGSLGDAETLVRGGWLGARGEIAEALVAAAVAREPFAGARRLLAAAAALAGESKSREEKRDGLRTALRLSGALLRDAALAAVLPDPASVRRLLPDLASASDRLARALGADGAARAAHLAERSVERLDRNLREELVIECFLLGTASEAAPREAERTADSGARSVL